MTETALSSPSALPRSLPLVVQVGFVGVRTLYCPIANPHIQATTFEAEALKHLTEILEQELGILLRGSNLFLCAISSMAVGGDMVFTRYCEAEQIMQRVFLPLPREEFLNARGSQGDDFSDAQKAEARSLLGSSHVIQERVVSQLADRRDRFHDVNLEIVRVSDVVVCLTRAGPSGKPGGTREALELARKRGRPVLEIEIGVKRGAPVFMRRWHDRDKFKSPVLPHAIAAATLPEKAPVTREPDIADFARGLKDLGSGQAKLEKTLFKIAALIIILAHVAATLLAVLALKLSGAIIPWLLGIELVLLGAGFCIHLFLHNTHRVERWALSRLAAEVARSVTSIGPFHIYLEHFFSLPFPPSLRPLLRTISDLHLRSTAATKRDSWEPMRDSYVKHRLLSPEHKAQIPFNQDTYRRADFWLKIARRTFAIASPAAFCSTLLKLLTLCGWITSDHDFSHALSSVFGILAIMLPVIAVAALSLASAFDLEAGRATSEEMLEFLNEQKVLLENASSHCEFSRLLIETESRLLGETVNWYARRSFVGVA